MKNMLAIVVAVGLGLAAVVMVRDYLQQREEEIRGAVVEIVIAKEEIPAGTEITLDYVAKGDRLKRYIDDDTVMANQLQELLGQRLKVNKSKGSPLRWSDTGGMGIAGFADMVPPGKRAVSMSIDPMSGISGMLRPNDKIDIMLSYTPIKDLTAMGTAKSVIRYFMANISVLALDRTTGKELRGMPVLGAGTRKEGQFATVTFAVKPIEAEMLVFAETQGAMRFVLRNPKDDGPLEGAVPIDSENFQELIETMGPGK